MVDSLTNKTPLATKIFQDVLVEYLPNVMMDHGMAEPLSTEFGLKNFVQPSKFLNVW